MADLQTSTPEIFASRQAVIFGAALLLACAFITAFAIFQKSRRTSLEQARASTAVGDTAFFPVPQPLDPVKPLASFAGRALYFVEWKGERDALMSKAGMDDTKAFEVYQLVGTTGEETPFFYLKCSKYFYAKTQRRSGAEPIEKEVRQKR